MPGLERFVRELLVMRIVLSAPRLAPRRLERKADVCALRRLRQRRIDRRRERMHELRPVGIVEPERRAAAPAEVAAAGRRPVLVVFFDPRAIDADVLAPDDRERLLPRAEIDRV